MMTADKLTIVNDYIDETGVPVQVVPLANRLGIKVYRTPWPDSISGKIQRDTDRGGDSGFAIFVNQHHNTNRRRFTIAHEIAHFILHQDQIGDGIFDDALYRSGLSSRVERQANELAADILMLLRILLPMIDGKDVDVGSLAKTFQVSPSAMSIRLRVPYEK